jgi:hypothetical protein
LLSSYFGRFGRYDQKSVDLASLGQAAKPNRYQLASILRLRATLTKADSRYLSPGQHVGTMAPANAAPLAEFRRTIENGAGYG